MIFEISASDAGSKVEKSGGDVDGEDECGDAVADDKIRDRWSLDTLSVKKKQSC